MASIRVNDQALSDQFSANQAPVEVVGPDGRVLGAFIPGPVDPYLIEAGISREELLRLAADTGTTGFTGEQVLAHLRSLKCSS